MPERHRDDRGSAELVVATPLLLVLLMLIVQVAIWAHAGQSAQTITHQTLAAARTADATAADGHARADLAIDQLAGAVLTDVDITVDRSATTASVRLRARAPSLLPGHTWAIEHEASAPVERQVPAAGPEGAP